MKKILVLYMKSFYEKLTFYLFVIYRISIFLSNPDLAKNVKAVFIHTQYKGLTQNYSIRFIHRLTGDLGTTLLASETTR